MEDSQRAAELAKKHNIDVGLHINFTQKLTQQNSVRLLCDYHTRIARFLTKNKYNFLIYNPALRKQFEYVFQLQLAEFERLYGFLPSHIDGHHHMHLCTNMVIDAVIPTGQKVRRNPHFGRGEKSIPNRLYRMVIDKWLARRYLIADYFFSLEERINNGRLPSALALANTSIVEFETHPELESEYEWLMGNACARAIANLQKGTYAQLKFFVSPISNLSSKNG
jgi:predicted glycoside hydrolase/deacetylase ChbG (UPF0249 family)